MKIIFPIYLSILFVLVFTKTSQGAVFIVNSQQTFDQAQSNAMMNDSIIWESGTFSDIYMNITKDRLFIAASVLGGTVFNGASRVNINSDYITLQGFQFVGGDIGTRDVINTTGSYNHFNEINIRAYTSYKYLRVREESQYVRITYCNFENRLNLDDQNILSILVAEDQAGYHKIQYCSFKNFDGTGNDLGIEPIRIGLSTQANRNSRSLVEYCYFTQCNGDGEIISSKASQNVYRYNTFENNPKAELVLRHGSEAIVYGNFFLKGKGGVRVREGQNHYIYNNYFSELDDRTIYLQNESSDPLDNINIAFNTIIDCSEVLLGRDGNFKPTNVTFANNIFADPDDDLFEDATGTETWVSNLAQGSLGISLPASGLVVTDLQLEANNEGFFGLGENSPAINAALPGYAALPQFPGMDSIDETILFDLMKQARPELVTEKDLGSNEYPHGVLIQPIATEENTGPSYITSVINSIKKNSVTVTNLIQVFPNPTLDQINLQLDNQRPGTATIDIFDLNGTKVKTILDETIAAGQRVISQQIGDLAPGIYTIQARILETQTGIERRQAINLVKQ